MFQGLMQKLFQGLGKKLWLDSAQHVATTIAGALVTYGIIMGADQEKFVGSIVFLAGVAWSLFDTWQKHRSVTVAKAQTAAVVANAAAQGITIVPPAVPQPKV